MSGRKLTQWINGNTAWCLALTILLGFKVIYTCHMQSIHSKTHARSWGCATRQGGDKHSCSVLRELCSYIEYVLRRQQVSLLKLSQCIPRIWINKVSRFIDPQTNEFRGVMENLPKCDCEFIYTRSFLNAQFIDYFSKKNI